MKRDKKYFIIAATIFLILSLIIDLRNYMANGAIFVINGDIYDTVKFYLGLPGLTLSNIIILIIYQNIHNYSFYFMWSLALLLNSIIYGYLFYFAFPFLKKSLVWGRNKANNV
jgi:hypothetical protein